MRTRDRATAGRSRSGDRPPPLGSAVLVGLAAILVAAALPLSALLLAGRWATAEVTASTLAGERSTARAVGQQVDQSYADALFVFRAAAGRPSLRRGLSSGRRSIAVAGVINLRDSGPFADVGLFDPSRRVIAEAPADVTAPAPAAGAVAGVVTEGPVREVGARSLRALTIPVTGSDGSLQGYVTADIDVGRLITDPAGLRFATTGNSAVVGTDGRILIDGIRAHIGSFVVTPAILRLSRAHLQGTVIVTSVLTHRNVVLVYEPVSGRPWGVLTSQTTAEAFAGAESLTDRLQVLAAVFGGLGLLLAAVVTVMVASRDRRIRSQNTALAAAQETFHSAFDNAPTGVAVVGLDGGFRQVNRSMCELTGYSEAELLTRTITDITHPDDRAQDAAVLAARRAGQQHHISLEKRYLRRDGSLIWVALTSSLVLDADGRPDHLITHVADITELRNAATAAAAAAVQLADARDVAIAATAAKSTFLATMSHEIRTPMNAVIGMTGLLLDTELDTDQRQFAETVRSSGESLIMILNDILDFSKIEAGDLDLEVAPFGVRDCVESALELVALAAQHKNLELVAELSGGCPEVVVGDVTRFRQVVVNLAGNAVKFTEAGEVHVVVRGETVGTAPGTPHDTAPGTPHYTAPGDTPAPASRAAVRLTVTVTDTGIGIPADRLDRLFQAFGQADSSITRTHGGTGLGLVISRRLAAAMSGDVTVTSEVGVGSTFTFTALLGMGEPAAAGAEQDPLHGSAVLVVDDHATSRRVLGQLLGGWGAAVTSTADAAGALRLVTGGQRFDAAVIEMHLPDMDGPRLAAALRTHPAGGGLPLVLLTDLETRLTAQQRRPFAVTVPKPARATALHDALLAATRPDEPVPDRGAAGAPGSALDPAAPTAPSLRVLLAEDNQVNQKVAQLILSRLGHRVDIVGDGREAVDAVRRTTYDVVLMDVQMPRLDGLGATEIIRSELPADRQPRIVAMTANVFAEDRAACAAAGMDDYVPKPIRTADLAAALDRLGAARSRADRAHPV